MQHKFIGLLNFTIYFFSIRRILMMKITAPTTHSFRLQPNVMALTIITTLAASMVQADSGLTDLGTLGGTYYQPNGLSADGSVVVGKGNNATGKIRAFRWSQASGMSDLGTLGGDNSFASGVSSDGSVVVGRGQLSSGETHAFRWTQASGMVDLGLLSGSYSYAYGVSADGSVVEGDSDASGTRHAFRWTQASGMVDLGTLGGTYSSATGISSDGNVVVGNSNSVSYLHAFRWTQASGMVDLGTIGGNWSNAQGVSADGNAVVGKGATTSGNTHAFRWTQASGISDLGTLGGTDSSTTGISSDGSVVVGKSNNASGNTHAFRWTQINGMLDLGTLGGTYSEANGVSTDGSVVVGRSNTASGSAHAFRWTQASGIQSVVAWLQANGVSVANDTTVSASGVSADGSVVVGTLDNNHVFIARVANAGSGLVTVDDLAKSLDSTGGSDNMVLDIGNTILNGSHSNPLSHRVSPGQKGIWVAGDWGQDDHGYRDGNLGLAELGGGHNLGSCQINLSLGKTWGRQNLSQNGKVDLHGQYAMVEALIPFKGNLWVTLDTLYNDGKADIKRGYLNAGNQDFSQGSPNIATWAMRARLELDKAVVVDGFSLSPYTGLSYNQSRQDAYTETGGGFPAHFNARINEATELRMGFNTSKPVTNRTWLLSKLEGVHRFQDKGSNISGIVIGLNGFNYNGSNAKQNWLRAEFGVGHKVSSGTLNFMVNATTEGEVPNAWLAASYQMNF